MKYLIINVNNTNKHNIKKIFPVNLFFMYNYLSRDNDVKLIDLNCEKFESNDSDAIIIFAPFKSKKNVNELLKKINNKNSIYIFGEDSIYFRDKYKNAQKLYESINFEKTSQFYDCDISKYYMFDNKNTIYLTTSIGCIGKCDFCVHRDSMFKKIDYTTIIEDLNKYTTRYDVQHVVFLDNTMLVDIKYDMKIFEFLMNKNITFSFSTRSDILIKNEQYIPMIKELGCLSIELGVESGSQKRLDYFNKHITIEQNEKAISLIRENRIKLLLDFIMFDPMTTIEDLKKDMEFLKKNGLYGYYPNVIQNEYIYYKSLNNSSHYSDEILNIKNKFNKYNKKIEKQREKENNGTKIIKLNLLPYLYFEKLINDDRIFNERSFNG